MPGKSWDEISSIVMHLPDGSEAEIELTDELRAKLQLVQEKHPDLSQSEIIDVVLYTGLDRALECLRPKI